MMEASNPQYAWGQIVQTAADLHNDGSYPDQTPNALLVRAGEAGEVVQVGRHTDSGTVVYMVEFALNRVVGCFESELLPGQPNGGAQ
jgi:nitrogen fixation protein NifZ